MLDDQTVVIRPHVRPAAGASLAAVERDHDLPRGVLQALRRDRRTDDRLTDVVAGAVSSVLRRSGNGHARVASATARTAAAMALTAGLPTRLDVDVELRAGGRTAGVALLARPSPDDVWCWVCLPNLRPHRHLRRAVEALTGDAVGWHVQQRLADDAVRRAVDRAVDRRLLDRALDVLAAAQDQLDDVAVHRRPVSSAGAARATGVVDPELVVDVLAGAAHLGLVAGAVRVLADGWAGTPAELLAAGRVLSGA